MVHELYTRRYYNIIITYIFDTTMHRNTQTDKHRLRTDWKRPTPKISKMN